MVFELHRADRVGDALDGVRLPVREVVGRIDAPLVPGPVVRDLEDAVDDGVSHVQVAGAHVDLGAQNARALLEFADSHTLEQLQVLGDRSAAVRALFPDLRQSSSVASDLLLAQVADVGLARLDELDGVGVEGVEVVRGVVEVVSPIQAQPAQVFLHRVGILDILLGRVGVVEAQVADAPVLGRNAEVEPGRLGVSDVQVAIRLGREACHDPALVPAGPQVLRDDTSYEVRRGSSGRPCGGACLVALGRRHTVILQDLGRILPVLVGTVQERTSHVLQVCRLRSGYVLQTVAQRPVHADMRRRNQSNLHHDFTSSRDPGNNDRDREDVRVESVVKNRPNAIVSRSVCGQADVRRQD